MDEKKVEMIMDSDFMNILTKASEEAERLETNVVSDILIVKNLIYYSESYMSDFFNFIPIEWNKIKNAIKTETKLWAKEAKKNAPPKINPEEIENVEEFAEHHTVFDEGCTLIFANAPAFSVDGRLMDEIAFVLAMMDDNESDYVKSFFKQIKMDPLLVTRYYEGLMAEQASQVYLENSVPSEYNEYIEEIAESAAEEETEQVENQTEKSENGSEFVIPSKLRSFVKVFETEESEVSPILGRDKETEDLTKVLLKNKKSNAILVGKAGVGKTAIVEHLAWLIKNDKCAEGLKGKTILSLEVNDIIAGTTLRGMAEERFKNVANFLANVENVILFIDEIHNVVGAGNTGSDDKLDMANALKPILAREGISVIGATTNEEYNRIFAKDGAFKRRFEKIVVREPKTSEVYPMIIEQVRKLKKVHDITITKPVIEFIIKVSGCFMFETCNPDRTLDLIDKSMATAAYKGEKVVTIKTVMENFDADIKLYNKMSKEFKYSTASHEAGHFIVARYGPSFQKKSSAVSIIPADGYLGLTLFNDNEEDYLIDWDYNAHIEHIAISLGGRVAEKKYTGKYSSGAGSDLKHATEEARDMILKFGLSSTFSNRNSEEDFYEKKIKDLNGEIDRIINKAYDMAEKILDEHEELLKDLADTLVKKGVLVENDLERICKRHEGKKIEVKKPENMTTTKN